ncbi:hypothetical protein ACHAXA_008717 [Cyclostephanos tholiformis]|uniref:DUF6824 domain-containing protein n=1 Tax=Cyclostephanos tholiformis TaxID=382380 RepID=A0ABD3R942_9STRA
MRDRGPPFAASAFALAEASTDGPQRPPHLSAAPSWGSIDVRHVGTSDGDGVDAATDHRHRGHSSDDDGSGKERMPGGNANVITPAQTIRKTTTSTTTTTPSFVYPPSSPIKATSMGDDSASSESSSPPPSSTSRMSRPPRRSSPVVEMEELEELEEEELEEEELEEEELEEEELEEEEEEEEEEVAPAEWLPPQNAGSRRRSEGEGGGGGGRLDAPAPAVATDVDNLPPDSCVDETALSRSHSDATSAIPVEDYLPRPLFVGGGISPSAGRPRLVDASSRSNDSCEDSPNGTVVGLERRDYYYGDGRGPSSASGGRGRIQVVGGGKDEWDYGGAMMPPWKGVVSQSRSADSAGGDGEVGVALGASSNEWEPPRPTRQPMVPPPGPPAAGLGGGGEATTYPYPYPNSYYPVWDYYSGRNGGPPPPSQSIGSSHVVNPGYPASYYPQGRLSLAAYPGPPPRSTYTSATGGYAQYPPSSYPSQYQQHRRQYPPHHPAYSQRPLPPPPSSHRYRHPLTDVPLSNDDNGEQVPSLVGHSLDAENVAIRPQFQNVKRGKSSFVANVGTKHCITEVDAVAVIPPTSRGVSAAYPSCKVEDAPMTNPTETTPHTPRRRRRRNPSEKAAAAAAMAAAAAAAMRERKKMNAAAAAETVKRETDGGEEAGDGGTDDGDDIPNQAERRAATACSMTGVIVKGRAGVVTSPFSEEELKNLGSGDDEDIPAAKRAAMASAVALRAAAGGSPVEPPKSASEVDFDIADPPMGPITEPSDVPALENATLMAENDVLCGRGGGTNSQMGNRRFRALVRDFQPTYLMAKRREKPKMARSVVLIVRHRGGRFLRRDDVDGRLYEVGDEKAEAKTSQALREGLDVRATKTAANTLMGTTMENTSKRRKHHTTSPSLSENKNPSKRTIFNMEGGAIVKDRIAAVRPQPVHAPGFSQASRYSRPPPAAAVGGYYPPYPQQYTDCRYSAGYPPTSAVAATYEHRPPASNLPPDNSYPPSTMHHHVPQYSVRKDYAYPASYPGHAGPWGGSFPSSPRSSREADDGSKETASCSSDAAAFSPPRSQVQKRYPDALECKIIDHSDGCGAKLELTVVTNSFEGMPPLKRHREVQTYLKEKGLFEEIHALQINAWTGDQWEKRRGEV